MTETFRRALCVLGIVLAAMLSCAHAGVLTRVDVQRLLGEQYLVGEVQPEMPAYPLFEVNPAQPAGKPELKAYAFETVDFSTVRGYSGKPLDILIVMDLSGNFLSLRLMNHREPLFTRGDGPATLADYVEQHKGLTLRHALQVGKSTDTHSHNDKEALLHGIYTGTVTAKAISRSVMVAAANVAREKLNIDSAVLGEGRVSLSFYKPPHPSESDPAPAAEASDPGPKESGPVTAADELKKPAPQAPGAEVKEQTPAQEVSETLAPKLISSDPAPTATASVAVAEPEWLDQWRSRKPELLSLLGALALLTAALFAQRRISANARYFRAMRVVYLLFTLIFIGWMAQGQLTVVNVTSALESLVAGDDLSFMMNDPITVVLWLFVIVSLFIWGRSTFCGWLCPFGALQELISMVSNAVGIRHRKFRAVLDAKLKVIKYVVLAVIVASLYIAPDFAGWAFEIEPFKTAISLGFVRSWPYVLWAVACLALTVFVYRGYCRYICPLGAALATLSFVRRWRWIPRRDACGNGCQTCRHRCEYQAIEQSGKINYHECFQCLDCVALYQDDKKCLPLIRQRKSERVITIKNATEAL